MVAIDATFLPYLLGHATNAPNDPATQQPIDELQERIDLLIETLQEDSETIIIPTPVLCEFLVLAKNDGPKYQALIAKDPLYSVKSFDERAAIELAAIYVQADANKSKSARKRQTQEETWARMKFDRQIVAIAKVNKAHTICAEDKGVANFAISQKIKAVRVWELPKPPVSQQTLPFPAVGATSLTSKRTDNVAQLEEQVSQKVEVESDE